MLEFVHMYQLRLRLQRQLADYQISNGVERRAYRISDVAIVKEACDNFVRSNWNFIMIFPPQGKVMFLETSVHKGVWPL